VQHAGLTGNCKSLAATSAGTACASSTCAQDTVSLLCFGPASSPFNGREQTPNHTKHTLSAHDFDHSPTKKQVACVTSTLSPTPNTCSGHRQHAVASNAQGGAVMGQSYRLPLPSRCPLPLATYQEAKDKHLKQICPPANSATRMHACDKRSGYTANMTLT
jgi:hypothetical protein